MHELAVASRNILETEQDRAERLKALLREEAKRAIEAYLKRAKNVESFWHLRKVATLKINGDNDQVCGKRSVSSVLFYDVERAGKQRSALKHAIRLTTKAVDIFG